MIEILESDRHPLPPSCDEAVSYTRELVRMESITPSDGGVQHWIAEKLLYLGASVEQFNINGVSNLIARFDFGEGPSLAFCGHTDVVPPGDISKWHYPPFAANIKNGLLYGRGVADMKGGIACAIAAIENLIEEQTAINGQFWFLITSDEEGEAEFGSKEIVNKLLAQGVKIDYSLIGEPTASRYSGDVIKIGRRGSLSFELIIRGKSAHVAYSDKGINAIHLMSKIINSLADIDWAQDPTDDLVTTLQVTHISSGEWTDNIVPSKTGIHFNVRYTGRYTKSDIINIVNAKISELVSDFTLIHSRNCEPFSSNFDKSDKGSMVEHARKAIWQVLGTFPVLSSRGGTSDGRFFKRVSNQVIEIGLPNGSIHQENERVAVQEITRLHDIYKKLFSALLS